MHVQYFILNTACVQSCIIMEISHIVLCRSVVQEELGNGTSLCHYIN